jgi:RNA polymerase sigma-70 factor (ECF subfamily)
MVTEENCQDKKDEELVNLVIKNQEYFLCLMKRYENRLFKYLQRITGLRNEELEDLLQDVFIKVYKNIYDFDQDLKFSSWIYRIAHNQAISNFRKSSARPQIAWDEDGNILSNIRDEFSVENDFDREILQKNINEILNQLDEKYREVLVLKFLEEKDYKEISDILKKPMGTVATLINRSKKQFLKKMAESGVKI